VSSPQRHGKKSKKDPISQKLNKQLCEVIDALCDAPITPEVVKASLGAPADQRHHFQEQVVEAIGGLLDEKEASLRKEVADVKAKRDDALAEKSVREKESEEAADKLKAKGEEVHGFKVVLAEKAMEFRAATNSLAEAEEAKRQDGKKIQEAEKKRSQFEAGIECLSVLKEVSPQDAQASQKGDELMAMLKKFNFEESLLIALPVALVKAPDARGQFDVMAMTEVENELSKLIKEQSDILAAAAPSQEQCQAAVTKAQEHLAAARAEQRAAARDYDLAAEEQVACETAATQAQKILRENTQLTKKLEKSLNSAEVDVELFEQGPRETFKELRERRTPEPVAEEEAAPVDEEEAAAELPAATEPMTGIEEAPVAVAAC